MSQIENRTCISDRPIDANADALQNDKYAQGLLKFIISSDTPVTIGIQGGWGSGKTSLINILKHHLDHDGKSISVFVNAWEHSLFHNESDKSSVAISLLSGVIESICEAIESKTFTPEVNDLTPRINPEIKSKALKEDSSLKRIGKVAVGLVALSARIGAKFVADVDVPVNNNESTGSNRPSGAKLIRELRDDLNHAVKTITNETSYKRFVCFIDDLDRVHPRVAIEILDVLKNVFDVPGCIFVLAIDYDVVVKGLKDKFGEMTSENEREFRQYFDKIIQVPFAMPIGAYSKKMEEFLRNQFISLNLKSENLRRISDVALKATDGIPRGVKRIVNTLSLLLRIREATLNSDERAELTQSQLEILFIVVALQINFPEIYRKIAENPDFESWSIDELDQRWQLEADEYYDERGDFLSENHGDAFDDDWEQVVFCLCQSSDYLKRKAISVSDIMNHLKDIIHETSGKSMDFLGESLDAVNVTDVDARPSFVEKGSDKYKNDAVSNCFREIHRKVHENLKRLGIKTEDVSLREWAKASSRGAIRNYDAGGIDAKCFCGWQMKLENNLLLILEFKAPYGETENFRRTLKDLTQKLNLSPVEFYKYKYSMEISQSLPEEDLKDDEYKEQTANQISKIIYDLSVEFGKAGFKSET